jgi:hypothetical protein
MLKVKKISENGNEKQSMNIKMTIEEANNQSIPQGQTKEDIKIRRKFIMDFYAQWNASNPGKRIYNADLKDFIYVRFLSMQETAEHAALHYKSTKAVTYLTEILELATIKTRTKPKPEISNQKRFQEIIIMEYNKSGLGKLKLTVGVLRGSKMHIQYCITAIEKTTTQPARTRNN